MNTRLLTAVLCCLVITSVLGTVTPTQTLTPTNTLSVTKSKSKSRSPTLTPSFTVTPSETDSETRTSTSSPTVTESTSLTPSTTLTSTRSGTQSETDSPTSTRSVSTSVSDTPTVSLSTTSSRSATITSTLSSTPTPTQSLTPTQTITPSQTLSATATRSTTRTQTVTPTPTQSDTSTRSSTLSETRTPTATGTDSETRSQTLSPSRTSTISRSTSVTPSATDTGSPSETATPTATSTPSVTLSSTRSATNTRSETATSTSTGTRSATVTLSRTSTVTATPTVTLTPSATFTRSTTLTPSVTGTRTRTSTRSRTVSGTLSATPTRSSTRSASPTFTQTPSSTSTRTRSPTPTRSESLSRSATQTPTRTNTLTPSQSLTSSRTVSLTPTVTLTPSQTDTPSLTETPTRSSTSTRTATPSRSFTSTGSTTGTKSRTATVTATRTATPSRSATDTDTRTQTLLPTRTQTPSCTSTRTRTGTRSQTATLTPTPTETDTPSLSSTRTVACHFNSIVVAPINTTVDVGNPLYFWVTYRLDPKLWCDGMARAVSWQCAQENTACSIGTVRFPLDATSFSLAASSLLANRRYNFTVTLVAANGDTAQRSVVFLTVASPLVVSIAGGSRVVPSDKQQVLDASSSFDPSPPLGAVYTSTWAACRNLGTSSCDSSLAPTLLRDLLTAGSFTSKLTLSTAVVGALADQIWRFTYTLSDTSSNRSSSVSATIQFSSSLSPVQVSLTTSRRVNYDQPLYLRPEIRDPTTGEVPEEGAFTYSWTSPQLDLSDPSITLGLSQQRPETAVRAGVMRARTSYDFSLQLVGKAYNVTSSVNVAVNQGPALVSQLLTITSPTGATPPSPVVPLLDSLVLSISPLALQDADRPLQFRFALQHGTDELALLGSSGSVWTLLDPPPGALTFTVPIFPPNTTSFRVITYVKDGLGAVSRFAHETAFISKALTIDQVLATVAQSVSSTTPSLGVLLSGANALSTITDGAVATGLSTQRFGVQATTTPSDVIESIANSASSRTFSSDQLAIIAQLADTLVLPGRNLSATAASSLITLVNKVLAGVSQPSSTVLQQLFNVVDAVMQQHPGNSPLASLRAISDAASAQMVIGATSTFSAPTTCDPTQSWTCRIVLNITRDTPVALLSRDFGDVQVSGLKGIAQIVSKYSLQLTTMFFSANPFSNPSVVEALPNSSSYEVSLYQADTSATVTPLSITNIPTDNRVAIRIRTTGNSTNAMPGATCGHWREAEQFWSTGGVEATNAVGASFLCKTTHLTAFAIIKIPAPPAPIPPSDDNKIGLLSVGGFIAVIVIAGVLCLLCLLLLILLLCRRRKHSSKEITATRLEVAANPLDPRRTSKSVEGVTPGNDETDMFNGWLNVALEGAGQPRPPAETSNALVLREQLPHEPEGTDRWYNPTAGAAVDGPVRLRWRPSDMTEDYSGLQEIAAARLRTIPARLGVQLQMIESLITVISVQQEGPMDVAGVLPGDRLIEMDGMPIVSVTDFQSRVQVMEPGTACTLTVDREGRLYTVPVRAGASVREAEYRVLQRVALGDIRDGDEAHVRYSLVDRATVLAW
eukprot:TRINITY_DN9748_c0_g1_i1.p1 TRINITY_DN9748_c0_g1~~TRINITY_DN9748_c0_g1_i1.p1  ORF type:complete len:1567 (-),score=162.34 TRINITY_DN9748_c0_g1_i1:58-4758(-)